MPKYSDGVMRDLREARDLDADDESQDEQIAAMPMAEALVSYLEYNGIVGYDSAILGIIHANEKQKGTK